MDFSKVRVLVAGGSGKQAVVIVRALKEIGCHVTVICSKKNATCYVSNRPDEKILNPHIANMDEEFYQELLEMAKSGKYDVLMPIGEKGTDFVTSHEEELKQYVRLACAPRSSYINAFDKQRTFEAAARAGTPMPKTRLQNQTVEEFLETVAFPLIIKPRNGMGSVGYHKFEKREDFEPYIREHGIDLDQYVLQEYVDHEKRLGTILFMDAKGQVDMAYADVVLRWFPIDAGTACMLQIVDAPKELEYSAGLLREMNWQGVAAMSYMMDRKTGEPRLLEINGRIPASIRLSEMCGYNVGKLLVQLAYGDEIEPYPAHHSSGRYLRHLDMDLAWFLKAKNRFHVKPSWFSWRKTTEVLFYRDDMRPFFSHFFAQLKEYRNIRKKKQH